jgi:hypothetical protein
MVELKTQKTGKSVKAFLDGVDEMQRADCEKLVQLMSSVTKSEPALWGPSMVGFGKYHYVYESGREGDWFLTGFSPRKGKLSIYIMAGFESYDDLMQQLGKHKTGKSCLYVKTLDDIDMKVLRKLVTESVRYMKKTYPS